MKKLFLLPIAALAFAGCSNDLDTEIQNLSEKEVITAQMPEGMSRTTTDNKLNVLWAEGDQIGVFRTKSEAEPETFVNNCFTLSNGAGTVGASFTAEKASGVDNVFAYYPYNGGAGFSGSNMTITLPAEQNYDDGNQLVMVGEFEEGSSAVSFKNAMALAVITVKNIPANYSKAVLTASDGEYLAGTAKASIGDNGATLTISRGSSKTLTINFGDNVETEKRFYFAIPTGTYANGLTMTLEGEDVNPFKVGTLKDAANTTEFTPEVNEFFYHNIELNAGVTTTQEVSTIEELKQAIAAGGNVVLTSDITGVSELLKVEKDLVIDLNGHTLGFTPQIGYPGIKNTATLEIKNGGNEGGITSTQAGIQNNGKLTVNCDITSVENAINNVYDGETTINGGSFKNTSENHALINSNNYQNGTPVLIINGGTFNSVFTNVSYNNSSTGAVNGGTFTCTGGWHNIYVGGENGGCNVTYDVSKCRFTSNGVNVQVNNWGVEGNKNTLNGVEYSGVHNIVYASEVASLKTAVAAGGNVVLTSDITGVSELLKVEKDLVVDLNGYTLAFTPQNGYPGIKNTATLEIKNGGNEGGITSKQAGIQNNGKLTVNCDITSVENAINNVYDGETTINGGSFKNTSESHALINSNNYEDGTPVLTINGGTFESVFTNVSYNNYSTGAVNGGTFTCTGGWHNVYVGGEIGGCNVTYNASTCSFTSNGINIQVNDWGIGNTNTVNNQTYTTTQTLMD